VQRLEGVSGQVGAVGGLDGGRADGVRVGPRGGVGCVPAAGRPGVGGQRIRHSTMPTGAGQRPQYLDAAVAAHGLGALSIASNCAGCPLQARRRQTDFQKDNSPSNPRRGPHSAPLATRR
jgi:hypothetical protein